MLLHTRLVFRRLYFAECVLEPGPGFLVHVHLHQGPAHVLGHQHRVHLAVGGCGGHEAGHIEGVIAGVVLALVDLEINGAVELDILLGPRQEVFLEVQLLAQPPNQLTRIPIVAERHSTI